MTSRGRRGVLRGAGYPSRTARRDYGCPDCADNSSPISGPAPVVSHGDVTTSSSYDKVVEWLGDRCHEAVGSWRSSKVETLAASAPPSTVVEQRRRVKRLLRDARLSGARSATAGRYMFFFSLHRMTLLHPRRGGPPSAQIDVLSVLLGGARTEYAAFRLGDGDIIDARLPT